jgi:hypothetical protein
MGLAGRIEVSEAFGREVLRVAVFFSVHE